MLRLVHRLHPLLRPRSLSPWRAGPLRVAACLWPLLLAGCALPRATPPGEAPPALMTPPPPPQIQVLPVEVEPTAPAAQLTPSTASNLPPTPQMLAYADKLRPLAGNDLAAEIARLGDPGDSPTAQMQLALALAQTRVAADLARALGLMQRVIANPSPEARALQPLARALAARYMEQRRVEDERDRQAQQLREAQRRNDQLNDRMEALRAIERSFARPNNHSIPAAPPPSARPTP